MYLRFILGIMYEIHVGHFLVIDSADFTHSLLYIDGLVEENVTPVRWQWNYVFLGLTYRYGNCNDTVFIHIYC